MWAALFARLSERWMPITSTIVASRAVVRLERG
jgi:hypothetical protein